MILRDVAGMAEAPAARHKVPPTLSREQWQALIQASRNEHGGLLIELLLKTGLRISEALDLRWARIDLDEGAVTVGKSKTAAGTNRTIPIDKELLTRMKSEYARQSEIKLASGGGWNPSDLVFVTATGNKQSVSNLRRRLYKRIKARAGTPDGLTFHALRHNCGSYLLSENVPLAMVSRVLGHRRPSTTAAIYIHELAEDAELVRGAMARVTAAS